jgi:hypothetical protein
MNDDPVWYDNVKILWMRYDEFFPSRDQSDAERLNAIVRLIAYTSAAAFLVHLNAKYLAFGAAAIVVISAISKFKNSGTYMHQRPETYANVRPNDVKRGNARCSRPTMDNPFSNMTIGTLLQDPNRPPACSYDAPGVAAEMRHGFNQGLVKNLEDIYEVENSQRQFYTMPVTTSAPDTIAFAQFLYGSRGQTCKELPGKCEPRFATRD